jgi:hypothetical protein
VTASLTVSNRFVYLPFDSVHTDACFVQLKGYRDKDSYFTIAAFPEFVDAREFVVMFPHLASCTLRVVDCYGNTLYRSAFGLEPSKHHYGSYAWWLDQSAELKELINGDELFITVRKSVVLPKFSFRNTARKLLSSFIKK